MSTELFINKLIHRRAKISMRDFLDRVECVRKIRTDCGNYLPLFNPKIIFRDEQDWAGIEHVSEAIRDGIFSGVSNVLGPKYYIFGMIVSEPVSKWFLNCPPEIIQRQLVAYLAYLVHFRNPCCKIFDPIVAEIELLRKKYFTSYHNECDEAKERYLALCENEYGSLPPNLLNPWLQVDHAEWGYKEEFGEIQLNLIYFTEDDWESIVKGQEKDELDRIEASSEWWTKWRHTYLQRHHHYRLYKNDIPKGIVYLIQEGTTGQVKIGYTENSPQDRLSALQTGNSNELELVGSFTCSSPFAEKALQEHFKPKQVRGEWFSLSDQDITDILNSRWRADHFIF